MLHAHAPTFLFPCSYLHASIVTCKKLELTATLVFPCSHSHVPVQITHWASEKSALTAFGNSDGWRQLTMMTTEVDGCRMVISQSWISMENSTWLSYLANFKGNVTFVRIPNWHHGNNKDFYNSDANLVNFKGNSFESTKLTPCA